MVGIINDTLLKWYLKNAEADLETLAKDVSGAVEIPDETLPEKVWMLQATNFCRTKAQDNRAPILINGRVIISKWAANRSPFKSNYEKSKCGLCKIQWIKGVSKVLYFLDLTESPAPGTEPQNFTEFVACASKFLYIFLKIGLTFNFFSPPLPIGPHSRH